MKKSKIIIPAAAILALSVGASITGTVAWFTASRTVSATVNNLAAINTSGDLGVEILDGDTLVGATKESNSSVNLSYLQDASYDAANDLAYVSTLNNDGSLVTGTRLVDKKTSKTVAVTVSNQTKYENVYVVNQWQAKFTTSSTANNYLYFDPTNTASHVTDEIKDAIGDNSVFKSVRVAMNNVNESLYTVWAPSTGDTSYYYVKGAGTLGTAQDSSVAASPAGYGDLVGKYSDPTNNHVSKHGDATVSEGLSKTVAEKNTALLSKTLKGGAEPSTPTIRFTVWFEGLDPYCIAGKADISSTTAAKVVKSLTLGFYAVDSTTFTTQQ